MRIYTTLCLIVISFIAKTLFAFPCQSLKNCRRTRSQTFKYLIPNSVEVEGNSIWNTRRKIIRNFFSSDFKTKLVEKEKKENDDEEKELEAAEKKKENDKLSLAITTFLIVISGAILRIGGRAGLMQFLGLDFMNSMDPDNSLKVQVDSFVDYFQGLGVYAFPAFTLAWVVAKTLCLDIIGIALAFSSGVLFGGFVNGTVASVVSSTIASTVAFFLSRSFLREKANIQIEQRPLLRAVEKSISRDGFKTVFALRLSPLLPIPVGMYSYLYGATALKVKDFVAGMALGSLKPMALDSYLGLFLKGIVDKDTSQNDLVLFGVLTFVLLAGTFATQVVTSTVEEINQEATAIAIAMASATNNVWDSGNGKNKKKDGLGLGLGLGDVELELMEDPRFSGNTFRMLGITKKDIPSFFLPFLLDILDASQRVNAVLDDEFNVLMKETAEGTDVEALEVVDWNGTVKFNVSPQIYPGNRTIREFEKKELSSGQALDKASLLDSLLFSFCLIAFLFSKGA